MKIKFSDPTKLELKFFKNFLTAYLISSRIYIFIFHKNSSVLKINLILKLIKLKLKT